MAAFLVDRTANLHGKGVQSGQWFWEELQLCDSVQAQATVEYQVQVIEDDRDGDDTILIRHPKCTEAIVFDDHGDPIELPAIEQQQLMLSVVEAFIWNMERVVEYERQLRFVVPVR